MASRTDLLSPLDIGCYVCQNIYKLNRLNGSISWAQSNPFAWDKDESCKKERVSALAEFIHQCEERRVLCEKLVVLNK